MTPQAAATRPMNALVIDDELQMRRALGSVLRASDWKVELAETGEQGLSCAAERTPDIVVLDLSLPDISGFEVCRRLRAWYSGPILVLSVRGADEDKIEALNLGADDYLTKPFSSGELLARMRAILRRTSSGDTGPSSITAGDVTIDIARRVVDVRGEIVHLTRTEFDILAVLMRHLDRVVTHTMLFDEVWGPDYFGDTKSLRTHVSHLRGKIERPDDVPRHILTEPGVGFRFVNPGR